MPIKKEELLEPCTCKATAEEHRVGMIYKDRRFWVGCTKCLRAGPRRETRPEAAKAWNEMVNPETTKAKNESVGVSLAYQIGKKKKKGTRA